MFRSAASAFDSQLCGILLSGTLDDGVAGLAAIHARGGIVMVQDPDDAQFSDMPQNALNTGIVDRRLPASMLAAAIAAWIKGLPATPLPVSKTAMP